MRRSERKLKTPDVGILAVRLPFGLQSELFARAAQHGFDDLRPRHGAVLAYLDEDGIRLGDLARIAGRRSRASLLRHASRPIRTPQDAKSTYGGALITIGFHFGKPTDGEVQLRTADRCITQLNQVQEAPG